MVNFNRYRATVPLLKKIEDVVLGTNTGAAPSLATYYSYWEKNIFKALNLMALNGLGSLQELFRESLERKVMKSLLGKNFLSIKFLNVESSMDTCMFSFCRGHIHHHILIYLKKNYSFFRSYKMKPKLYFIPIHQFTHIFHDYKIGHLKCNFIAGFYFLKFE